MVRAARLADSMSYYLIQRIEGTPNISLHTHTQITVLDGTEHLERMTWFSADGVSQTHDLRHLFLMLGASPNTRWLAGHVALDASGFVVTGPDLTPEHLVGWKLSRSPYLLEASIPGVFAAGDARSGSTKRIAAAVGEGSRSCSLCIGSFVRLRSRRSPGLQQLRATSRGLTTTFKVHQTGVSPSAAPDNRILGWQESHEHLARLVEPEIPD